MTTGTVPLTVEYLDPATLLVDANLPGRGKPDRDLVESVRQSGVLQPVIAYRTAEGRIRVRYGHRRTLAALEAGQPCPVLVVADETADDRDDVERLLGQFAENKYREPLNAAQEAFVVQRLFDLGLPAGEVRKRTRLPEATITAARKVAASPAAVKVAGEHRSLTIDQAASIADFADDQAAVRELTEAAEEGDGQFRHMLQALRDSKTEREAIAGKAAELTGQGVRVVSDRPAWDHRLSELQSVDGKKLTPAGHKKCPGHVAYVWYGWHGDDKGDSAQVIWACADPKANGHKKLSLGSDGDPRSADERKAERRETIANNKAWRSAKIVRVGWLREFLTRQAAPKDALRFVIEALAVGGRELQTALQSSHSGGRELMGLDGTPATWDGNGSWSERLAAPMLDAIGKASDQRALMIALGLIVGAYEAGTYDDMWKNPGQHAGTRRFFEAIATWGYTLSPIEQTILTGTKLPAPDGGE